LSELEEDVLTLIAEIGFAALPNRHRHPDIFAIWNAVLPRMNQEDVANW
jgi:hypothetical protein